MINLKSIIAPAVIGYGLYYAFTHYDFAPFPPMDGGVKEALVRHDSQYSDFAIDVVKDCNRTQGGMTDAVYTCGVEFIRHGGHERFMHTVKLAKKKGKWVVQSMGARQDAL